MNTNNETGNRKHKNKKIHQKVRVWNPRPSSNGTSTWHNNDADNDGTNGINADSPSATPCVVSLSVRNESVKTEILKPIPEVDMETTLCVEKNRGRKIILQEWTGRGKKENFEWKTKHQQSIARKFVSD